MLKISQLVIPLLKNKEVDYPLLKELINQDKKADGFILFSPLMEGNTFSLKEKKEIYSFIKSFEKRMIFYEISSYLSEEEISNIKEIKVDALIFTLLKEKKINSLGHETYIRKKMKEIGNIPFYVHHEKGMDNTYLSFQSIYRLKRNLPNFQGIFEENQDSSLLHKLSAIKDFSYYLSLKEALNTPSAIQIEGIFLDFHALFYKEIDEYFQYQELFINSILKRYLLFVDECIALFPRAMAIKYLLSKVYNKEIYSRLPYYTLKKEESDPLDYLL